MANEYQADPWYDCPFVNAGHPWFKDPCQLGIRREARLVGGYQIGSITLASITQIALAIRSPDPLHRESGREAARTAYFLAQQFLKADAGRM